MRCPHCGTIEPAPRDDGVRGMNLMPPPMGLCRVCAHDHAAEEPHNAQSLYYAMAFNMLNGRSVTWADAVAHLDEERLGAWRAELQRRGLWTEPPDGIAPIKHLGVSTHDKGAAG